MGWGYNNVRLSDDLPRITTYAAALEHHNQVVPLRAGADKGLRVLGYNRRYKRSTIVLNDDMSVSLCFWGSHIFRFYGDGRIELSHCGYTTPSTYTFMCNVFGLNYFKRRSGKFYYVIDGKEFYIDRFLTIKEGQPVEVQPESYLQLKREAMKEVRNRYKPFIQYCTNICTLTPSMDSSEWYDTRNHNFCTTKELDGKPIFVGDPTKPRFLHITIDKWELGRRYDLVHTEMKYLFSDIDLAMRINDFDLMYIRYLNIFDQANVSLYDRSTQRYSKHLSVAKFKKYFDELLKYYFFNELFERKEAEVGKSFVCLNGKYVPKNRRNAEGVLV